MLGVLIFLIIIIFKADARGPDSENPEVRLSNTYTKEENYTVFKDKPLKIIIENGYARYVWCSNSYGNVGFSKFVPVTEFSNEMFKIINITKVTAEMSTRWSCTILKEYHGPVAYTNKNRKYTAKDLLFNLHVKGARAVYLTANNRNLTYVTTNLSVNYDGEANYTYEDGEDFLMDFSCKRADDDHEEDTLRLEYYNAEGILLFKTRPRVTPNKFRSVLKSNNDKYYLDCIRTASDLEWEYRYRTTFFKLDLHADAVQQTVILSVNGQRLTRSFNKYKSYIVYIFRYIDLEVLNVTCRKMNVFGRGTLTFHYDKENIRHMSKILRSPSEAEISINISTSYIANMSLICGINNTDIEEPNAKLLFLSDVPDFDIRIRGLPRNNILYQYTNDEYLWTIEYQYSVNDTLSLTCVWNKGFKILKQERFYTILWEFETIRTPRTRITFSGGPFTKILDATHNGTIIKCTYTPSDDYYLRRTVEIILRLKPELVSEAKRDKDTSGETSTHSYTLVYCLTAAGVSVIIILVILYWTVKKSCCCIRSSSQELPPVPAPRRNPATVYYENLLSVFQQINEREAAELENHYEVIQ